MDENRPLLVLIGGEAWTGKTTCARLLLESTENAAWLDGDDVWRVNPWSLDDSRLRTSDVNMAFVVQTYLRSAFDVVILSSIVLSDPDITARILGMIEDVDHDLVRITLTAEEGTLRRRAEARDGETSPTFLLRERAQALRGTVVIDTSDLTPEEVVRQMRGVLDLRGR